MSTNDDVYEGLQPAAVWRHFAALNDIPRLSQHEEAARDYVQRIAREKNAEFQVDDYGNCVVRVPASAARFAEVPLISFQSHLDMVCQHLPEVSFDPLTDGIRARREGDRIYAQGTTLGADNGIGVALMLALLTDPPASHGPLELLFTVEEEIGLTGAVNLDPALVQGRTMINLDGDPNVTVGCAGGEGVDIVLPLTSQPAPEDTMFYEIRISGLVGGHSGVQINEPRGNAIKIATKVLLELYAQNITVALCDVHGGSAHNTIPRDAVATIAVSSAEAPLLEALLAEQSQALTQHWRSDEPGLEIKVLLVADRKSTFDATSTLVALQLLDTMPHGVHCMSERFADKVETSCNLSNAATTENALTMHVSVRSLIADGMESLVQTVIDVAQRAGASAVRTEGYPGWEPRAESPLADIAARAMEEISGEIPEIRVIHAGLECGVIASKIDDLDVISIGPQTSDLHSPDESVTISTVKMIWDVMAEILNVYAQKEES